MRRALEARHRRWVKREPIYDAMPEPSKQATWERVLSLLHYAAPLSIEAIGERLDVREHVVRKLVMRLKLDSILVEDDRGWRPQP
jgi:predicted ArsR family transcriptional regulator